MHGECDRERLAFGVLEGFEVIKFDHMRFRSESVFFTEPEFGLKAESEEFSGDSFSVEVEGFRGSPHSAGAGKMLSKNFVFAPLLLPKPTLKSGARASGFAAPAAVALDPTGVAGSIIESKAHENRTENLAFEAFRAIGGQHAGDLAMPRPTSFRNPTAPSTLKWTGLISL